METSTDFFPPPIAKPGLQGKRVDESRIPYHLLTEFVDPAEILFPKTFAIGFDVSENGMNRVSLLVPVPEVYLPGMPGGCLGRVPNDQCFRQRSLSADLVRTAEDFMRQPMRIPYDYPDFLERG
jgi:hypothetical protein